MRKGILILIVCITSLFLLGNSQADMGGIPLKSFPNQSELKLNLSLQSKHLIEELIVVPKEPFDQLEAASMIARIDLLPQSLLAKLNENDIKVELFVGKLTDNPTADHLKGIIPRGYKSKKKWDHVPGIGGGKTVLVKVGHSEKGQGHGSVNLELHELAHSVERHVYKELRHNGNFLNVWNAEKYSLFPDRDYFLTFPEEYFAETFAMFYVGLESRLLLKEKAPLTYEFINNLK
ncbi:toxin [Cytobacillus sp. FJAT-54145]|uniref:Toxin n=1 Tax=Cytobacillus spartinae TaxID=3299023 RepID=A0ABW6KCZ2_9BACI